MNLFVIRSLSDTFNLVVSFDKLLQCDYLKTFKNGLRVSYLLGLLKHELFLLLKQFPFFFDYFGSLKIS
jgi:hypothetical protein